MSKDLGYKIKTSKTFIKNYNDPLWDWTAQKWQGCIIRDSSLGCNYYDFSCLRLNLINDLRSYIIEGLKGNLQDLNEIIAEINSDLTLKVGDLIQIGKTKNRGLFIVSKNRLLPITQLLGGNGYGEIPLNFLIDNENNKDFTYNEDYWTYIDIPIITHVPYIKDNCKNDQNIRIGKKLFAVSEGSDPTKHPYVYIDFLNNEYFTLPKGIIERFNYEIEEAIKK